MAPFLPSRSNLWEKFDLKTVTTKEAQPQKPPWCNVNLVHDKIWVMNIMSLQSLYPTVGGLCVNWDKHKKEDDHKKHTINQWGISLNGCPFSIHDQNKKDHFQSKWSFFKFV